MSASAPDFGPQRFWLAVLRFGADWPAIFKQAVELRRSTPPQSTQVAELCRPRQGPRFDDHAIARGSPSSAR